jgi:uncharacterized protein (DUF1810 family)
VVVVNNPSSSGFDLQRFVVAQEQIYATALSELRMGQKDSHWMWYIFPQLRGLGTSENAEHYGIRGSDEARAYLAHPVLGPRLIECANALKPFASRSASEILKNAVDAAKLRSCATLFSTVSAPGNVFVDILTIFFRGEADAATITLLDAERHA